MTRPFRSSDGPRKGSSRPPEEGGLPSLWSGLVRMPQVHPVWRMHRRLGPAEFSGEVALIGAAATSSGLTARTAQNRRWCSSSPMRSNPLFDRGREHCGLPLAMRGPDAARTLDPRRFDAQVAVAKRAAQGTRVREIAKGRR